MKTVHLVSLQVLKGFAMLLILLASPAALAHKPSDSYLSLQVTETAIHGQWDIALRDLDYATRPRRQPGRRDHLGRTARPSRRHRRLRAGAARPCRQTARRARRPCVEHLVDEHSDGAYAVLRFSASCEAGSPCAQCQLSAVLRCRSPAPRAAAPRTRRSDAYGDLCYGDSGAAIRTWRKRPPARQFIDYIDAWRLAHLDRLRSSAVPAVAAAAGGPDPRRRRLDRRCRASGTRSGMSSRWSVRSPSRTRSP
jgi:hypothetical protein